MIKSSYGKFSGIKLIILWTIPNQLSELTRVLVFLLLLSNLTSAQELREMQYEELPADRIIIDRDDRGLLIVESTVPKLKFIGSNRPIPAEPGVKETMPGVWHVYLSVGTTLMTIQAEGYVPIQDVRVNLQPRQAKKLRVTAKPVFGEYGGFDVDQPEIRLKYTPASADERLFGGLDGGRGDEAA